VWRSGSDRAARTQQAAGSDLDARRRGEQGPVGWIGWCEPNISMFFVYRYRALHRELKMVLTALASLVRYASRLWTIRAAVTTAGRYAKVCQSERGTMPSLYTVVVFDSLHATCPQDSHFCSRYKHQS
jgi:hypothetical protein